MVHKKWKPEEERRLIEEFRKAGCSHDAITRLAKEFNRSPDAIRKKLQRLGLNVVGAKLELTTTFEIPPHAAKPRRSSATSRRRT
ncbi:MAG: hypothetical protein ACPLKQ_07240 [Candidatus Bathyarchaeales archaeon]